MNFVQPGAENPLVSQSFTMRPGLADAQSAAMPKQRYAMPYQPPDGFAPQGWAPGLGSPPQPGAKAWPVLAGGADYPGAFPGLGGTSSGSGAQGGFLGLINTLINQLGALINQYTGEANAEGPGSRTVGDGTFSSTGDPHLSETGNVLDGAGKASSVDRHFDSMTNHDNLVSSQDFDGGYRVSTSVTTPDGKGVTMNASATVHTNNDLDTVTMRNDGSVSIASNGNSVSLDAGQTVTLGGGEQVTRNTDGSLTVLEQNAFGGSISTTMAAKGGGVDVTASVHNATVGGDIASGSANPSGTSGFAPVFRNPTAYAQIA